MSIYYEAVYDDGTFKRYEHLDDIPKISYLLIVRKEETYACQTYTEYEAFLFNRDGREGYCTYKGYTFSTFRIAGPARNYCLYLPYKNPKGEYKEHVFLSDISFNHAAEDYKQIKPEWEGKTQYKVIFDYFDGLIRYGEDAYKEILLLERKLYAQEAICRQLEDELKQRKNNSQRLRECVKELHIPTGWTDIPNDLFYGIDIQIVFIPATVHSIAQGAFGIAPRKRKVICLATVPPQITHRGDWIKIVMGDILYVPKNAVNAYKNNSDWSTLFNTIKSIEEVESCEQNGYDDSVVEKSGYDYTSDDLDDMYRQAYEGDADAEWNTD